jgi:hypothetical protein
MWETMYGKLKTTLTALTGSGQPIQALYDYPETNLAGYPACIYFPSSFTNEYDSTQENAKTYQFTIFLLLETKRLGLAKAYNDAMPKLLDEVIAKFDEDWNQGQTTVGQHRIWWTLSNGAWGLVTAEKETYLQAELTLTIRFNTNI